MLIVEILLISLVLCIHLNVLNVDSGSLMIIHVDHVLSLLSLVANELVDTLPSRFK